MKRISHLTQTATEADLVSGNYLALDGANGTKKLPGNCVAPKSIQDNLIESIAPVFDSTVDYTAGQSVMYQGTLYTFNVDHSGAWDASHVNATNVQDYVIDIEDDINGCDKYVNKAEITTGGYWGNNAGNVDARTNVSYCRSQKIEVEVGATYKFDGDIEAGRMGAVISAWVGSDGQTIISTFIDNSETFTTKTFVAPTGAKYAVVSSLGSTLAFSFHKVYGGLKPKVSDLETFASGVDAVLNGVSVPIDISGTIHTGEYYRTDNNTITIAYNASYCRTERIEVSVGTTIEFTGNIVGGSMGYARSFFLKADGITMCGEPIILNSETFITKSFVVPNGAKYVCFSSLGSSIVVKLTQSKGIVELVNEMTGDVVSSPIYGKSIAYFGDSLMAGLEESHSYDHSLDVSGGIWKRLNDKYALTMVTNASEGGTILQGTATRYGESTPSTISNSISRKMSSFNNEGVDIILFTGGFNDATNKVAYDAGQAYNYAGTNVGTLSSNYTANTDYTSAIGSMEAALCHLIQTNPFTKIVWIKAWQNGGTQNIGEVKNFYDGIESACKKYGVGIIDLWNDSCINLCNNYSRDAFGRPNYSAPNVSTHDNTHLGANGFERIIGIIAKRLESLM